jgi:hypothetical protein
MPRLPGQASFAAEFVRPQDCDDSLLALLGDNGDFDLALLDIENCIRRTALREDLLVFSISGDGSADVLCVQKNFGIERRLSFAFLNINSLHRSTSIPRRGDLAGSSEMADTELTKATNRYVSNYQLTAC